ncbi:SRPBCC family protein [Lichenibacterium ramalinae]|uniref:Polyketide cyclase n=1 Tax=Lichenibacterium ramalinae TaxID=2316527 RepID=A0A4Q2RCC0_9HYPH|nr:SRPBCC family protein [Lichenibacterium ramalinae]RYB04707.1 polyketide cyclase [Lichenibacterium ramalinae]
MTPDPQPADDRDLLLHRRVDAPPAALYRCWTEPDLLKRWFAPEPWTVPEAEVDLRVGGASRIVMRGPDGTHYPSRGVYLEVVPDARLVFTDAFVDAWTPAPKPFMTVILTFAPEEEGRTRYTVRVRHWSAADRERHESLGFHQGWGRCADQMARLAETL